MITWAFLYTLLVQMSGSTLPDNLYWDKVFDLTLLNTVGIHNWLWGACGKLALLAGLLLILSLGSIVLAIFLGQNGGRLLAAIGMFIIFVAAILLIIGVAMFLIWAIGFIHVWLAGYFAANFGPNGPLNPGFWVILAIVILSTFWN